MIKSTDENKQLSAKKEAEVQEARAALYAKLEIIGNLVHDSVPISNDEVYTRFPIVFFIYMNFRWNLAWYFINITENEIFL